MGKEIITEKWLLDNNFTQISNHSYKANINRIYILFNNEVEEFYGTIEMSDTGHYYDLTISLYDVYLVVKVTSIEEFNEYVSFIMKHCSINYYFEKIKD